MKTTQDKIEALKNNGYPLDFSLVFEHAFELYKKMAMPAGLVLLLVAILISCVSLGAFFGIVGVTYAADTMKGFGPDQLSGPYLALYYLGMVVFSGLCAPFTGGLIRMAHKAHRNEEVTFGTAFTCYTDKTFGKLFVATALISVVTVGISLIPNLVELPAFVPVITAIITYIISALTFLHMPLIIFEDLEPAEAISASIGLATKQLGWILVLMIVAAICAMLGLIALCIGIFFTIPFVNAMQYAIYHAILPVEGDKGAADFAVSRES